MQHSYFALLGVGAILAAATLLSTDRRAIRPLLALRAFALQAGIAYLALYAPAGRQAISAMAGGVEHLLAYSDAGIEMVFGSLASEQAGFSFAVRVLPIIIFFSALMAILYHLRIMQWVVRFVGGLIRLVVGVSPVESVNAATTIFVGQSEAPLAIRPYLTSLTGPQLFATMVSGFAAVAGTVLAAYAQMGVNIEYLLAASFMAAPGGLLMAKIMMPDPRGAEAPALNMREIEKAPSPHANVIMAAAVGAQDGVKVAVAVGAMLIAFVSVIALLNGMMGGLGALFGLKDLSIQAVLGYVFAPIMYLLDVPWAEARTAGALFGEKLVLNEFIAYLHLGELKDTLSPRTEAIATFALCGFANFTSIAIQMGCIGALAPERLGEVARFGVRGVIAGSLANLMSAALAGLILPF